MEKRGDVDTDTIVWWVIAAVVLVLMFGIYMVLSGKATGLLAYIKNILRFGQ